MSRIALISDVHGNLPALEAVLRDAHSFDVEEIYFLGDVVGYGPQPAECMELLLRECGMDNMIMGNQDHACLSADNRWGYGSIYARQALEWTQGLMEKYVLACGGETQPALDWIRNMKEFMTVHGAQLFHGSPRDPRFEYIAMGDIIRPYETSKVSDVFAKINHLCFVGHTHVPGVMLEAPVRWLNPALHQRAETPEERDFLIDIGSTYEVSKEKALINVGSVGQPRDEDSRACYVLFDGSTVKWRRVEYDIEAVIALIETSDELNSALGDRLRRGR